MKIKVGVFFGGRSVEHEVSIISAIQAIANFDKARYDVVPIYITRENEFYIGEKIGDISAYKDIAALLKASSRVVPVGTGNGKVQFFKFPFGFRSKPLAEIEIAFPIVHGTNVEDGVLQGYLKTLGIPVVGCDVAASAYGMDKYAQKALFRDAELPVLTCYRFTAREFTRNAAKIVALLEWKLPYPMIVKPSNLGSSVGVTLANDKSELEAAIELASEFSAVILVEQAVTHLREINCAVLGDRDGVSVSECEEPIGGEILTYNDKYTSGGEGSKGAGMANLKRILPADIPQELKEKIQGFAVKAFQALGCSGVARIDFLYDTMTEDVWVNEINTIPGSLAFYLWESTGCRYCDLLDEMIELALKRDREERDLGVTIDTAILSNFSGSKSAKKLQK